MESTGVGTGYKSLRGVSPRVICPEGAQGYESLSTPPPEWSAPRHGSPRAPSWVSLVQVARGDSGVGPLVLTTVHK